jgi:hypothetical protein
MVVSLRELLEAAAASEELALRAKQLAESGIDPSETADIMAELERQGFTLPAEPRR